MSQFTKKAIVDSFLKLLSEKNFEKITVKNIVEECGVNRKTFYYYFEDIYDLAEQIFEKEIRKLSPMMTPEMNVEETVDLLCDLVEKNKRLITHSFSMAGEIEMRRLFYNVLCPAFEDRVRAFAADNSLTEEDIETVGRIITFSIIGSEITWITSGFDPDEKERLKKVCVMLQGSIPLMINNLQEYNSSK